MNKVSLNGTLIQSVQRKYFKLIDSKEKQTLSWKQNYTPRVAETNDTPLQRGLAPQPCRRRNISRNKLQRGQQLDSSGALGCLQPLAQPVSARKAFSPPGSFCFPLVRKQNQLSKTTAF